MKLAENLKRIRKENNLSQEQLADKLGVSRQSVSKWESNLAYPEMDKVLQICKMFNLNIDELLNKNIKEIKEMKQSKNNVNKIVDDFLDYITKTIDMFSCMKFKDKIKCLFEQFIITIIIIISLLLLGIVIENIVRSILSFLPDDLYYSIYNIFINGIYLLFCLVFGVSLVLYIFKVRYLDYYIILKEKKEIDYEEQKVEEENKQEKDRKKFFHKEKQTIIIREPKHSGYKFISTLIKCLLFLIKIIVSLIALCLCFSLVIVVIIFTLSFLFIKTNLVFIGSLLILISSIVINLILLDICYKFILNKKKNNKLLSISFIVSLFLIGIGTGLFLIGIKDFKYIDNLDNNRYSKTEKIIKMNDNLYFKWINDEDYIKTNSNEIKIVITHSNYIYHNIYINENGHIEIYYANNNDNIIENIKYFIEDINKKQIINYYNFDVKVYTSEKNIKKLKENRDKYYQEQTDYYNEKEQLIKYIQELIDENNKLKSQIDKKNNENCNIQN